MIALLDNIRSLYNVGAFFRTADAPGLESLFLCGITGRPPHRSISKTALGAETNVRWESATYARPVIEQLRAEHHEIAAIETSVRSVDLFDWEPAFPVCLIFFSEMKLMA